MEGRRLAGFTTGKYHTPQLPKAVFSSHTSLLTGIGITVDDVKDTKMVSIPYVLSLYCFDGEASVPVPSANRDFLKNAWLTCSEKGGVTQATFNAFIETVMLPFFKQQHPKLSTECLLLIDLPATHELCARVRKLALESGVQIYAIQHNTSM